ncbi:unnamed protein product [Adineta steineri]|uniref:Uncharacterized protein n=1 Tax=Adineta steineri TaxID=433720 RepID=A0A814GQV8_9BILA|nr:unnamed protein product [Adineta steineri]CAF1440323.1 unnamed protein product [Adineta steineri]
MNSLESDDEDMSIVKVSLNVTETTNRTLNGSLPKTFMKRTNDDSSISNILIGIGLVTVILIGIVIVMKMIYMCYKMWKQEDDDEDDNKKNQAKKSPLLPTSNSKVVRRNSSVRNPAAPMRRSSLLIETQMELRNKRLSQTFSNTPPIVKKP